MTQQSPLPFPNALLDLESRRVSSKSVARELRRPSQSVESNILAALGDHSKVLFLDIETTGLSRHYDDLTVVGWLQGDTYHVHLAGDDPAPLMSSLRSAAALVTFNGTLFDCPFLKKTFAGIIFPEVHVDLRYLARRASLVGGQKSIEKELGISVRDGVEDVDGAHAVLLWHRYLRGDLGSLRKLIKYNESDVAAMRHILDKVLGRLVIDPDLWYSLTRFAEHNYKISGWASSGSELPHASRLGRRKNTFESLFAGTPAENATLVGIDLTGSETRPSGWCVLRGAEAETAMVATDDEMVSRVLSIGPALVSIDSPLSIPNGRIHVGDDDPGRAEFGIMRRCERELKRRGINVYPCLLPSMQNLTKRGTQLAARLRSLGVPVIESYPGAAQDIMGIPRKGAGEAFLKQGLGDFGVQGSFLSQTVRHDELDAITSALVGSFFLAEKYEALSGPSENALILPDLNAVPGPLVIGISGRIYAGKTTAARFLETLGFAYTRFSLVVDDEIIQRGEILGRESRQRVGLEINRTKGQKWLCERVLARVGDQRVIVVDGLRFIEDRTFFFERFGSRFLHIHLTAPTEIRRVRYESGSERGQSFDEVDNQPVEGEIDRLGALATATVENSATIGAFELAVGNVVKSFVQKGGRECLFPSS